MRRDGLTEMKQTWSRQKCSHADMLAEELPTRMPTYVPTRNDLIPTIVPPLILIQLRHLGPLGLQYLCRHAEIPVIWKQAILIPLPKPNKLKIQGASYSHISILCPASKVLEKLLYTKILPHINLSET